MPGQPQNADPSVLGSDPAGSRWVLAALFVGGVLAALIVQEIAWVAVAFSLDFPEGTDSEVTFVALWLPLVLVPLVLLWFGRGRRRRWFAGGATVGTVVALIMLAFDLLAPTGAPDAQHRVEVLSATAQVPICQPGGRGSMDGRQDSVSSPALVSV